MPRTDRTARTVPNETELVRSLVASLDDETLLAIDEAITCHLPTLDTLGSCRPDLREQAEKLRKAHHVFRRATVVRDWIEEKEEPRTTPTTPKGTT